MAKEKEPENHQILKERYELKDDGYILLEYTGTALTMEYEMIFQNV